MINFVFMSYNFFTLEMIQYDGETHEISFYSGKILAQNGLKGSGLETVSEF